MPKAIRNRDLLRNLRKYVMEKQYKLHYDSILLDQAIPHHQGTASREHVNGHFRALGHHDHVQWRLGQA